MSRIDELRAALPTVTFRGQPSPLHHEHVAQMLASSNIPVEHAANLSAIHVGSPVAHGAGAVYDPRGNSLHIAGDPERIKNTLPGNVYEKLKRTTVHEVGHSVQRNLNPLEFSRANQANPSWRGRQEALAENYADKHLPGTYSGYDYNVQKRQQNFDSSEYKRGRGSYFGNIDPRLR